MGSVNGEMQCANIDILEDNDYELDHTFTADIMTITPDAIMNNAGTARIEITDDDGKLLLHPDHVLYNSSVSFCLQFQQSH